MVLEPQFLLVLAIVFVAALTRATFGFADALVAMPLLLLLLGKETAAPLVALMSVTIAAVVLIQDWRNVHLRDAGVLVVFAFVGIVLGFKLLRDADGRVTLGLLGIVLMVYSSSALWRPQLLRLKTDRLAPAFGVIIGFLHGAYNTPGPPLVMYGAMRQWSAQRFRATMQAYSLPTGLTVIAGHGIEGRLTTGLFWYYLPMLPLIVLCVILGRRINARFRTESFTRYLHVFLIILGATLITRAATSS